MQSIQGLAGKTKASRLDRVQLVNDLEQKFVGKLCDEADLGSSYYN